MGYEVEITTVATRTVAATHFHVDAGELDSVGERMGAAFAAVMAHLAQAGLAPEGPAVARYEPADGGFDVAAGFEVTEPFDPGDAVDLVVLPAAEVAHTTHLGAYDQLPAAYAALRSGAAARGRTLAEDVAMWEEYWSPPEAPPEETRTEVFWPLAS